MIKSCNSCPPGHAQSIGFAKKNAVNQAPEGNNENSVENQRQHGTPPDFRQTGLGLGKITGADGPFSEKNGDKGIAVETDENETHDRTFRIPGFTFDQSFQCQRFGNTFGHDCLTCRSQGFQTTLAQEGEPKSQYAVKHNVNDNP